MPPTMFDRGNVNMFQPYVVGQSGTDSPETVLVTKLPARIRRIVQATTKREYRCSKGLGPRAEGYGCNQPSALSPQPFHCSVRGGRRRLEHEVDFLRVLRADRDAMRHRAELLVPRLDRIGARRQVLDVELAVLVGYREVRMVEDADVGV